MAYFQKAGHHNNLIPTPPNTVLYIKSTQINHVQSNAQCRSQKLQHRSNIVISRWFMQASCGENKHKK
ncbi:hypothetical protein FKM82_000412 [Ascaphus truei]